MAFKAIREILDIPSETKASHIGIFHCGSLLSRGSIWMGEIYSKPSESHGGYLCPRADLLPGVVRMTILDHASRSHSNLSSHRGTCNMRVGIGPKRAFCWIGYLADSRGRISPTDTKTPLLAVFSL